MRRTLAPAITVVVATSLVLVGSLGLVRSRIASADSDRILAASADGQVAAPTLAATIETLQTHLAAQPTDERSWAGLGVAYVEQARITLNPTYYPKAQTALSRALALAPDDDAAHAGLAALDSARHDFGGALAQADRALAVNPYSAEALAIRVDALTELGRYPEALAAARTADVRTPGVPVFTRLSYQRELRGDVPGAVALMQRALSAASAASDIAFVQTHLGDLSRETGQLAAASADYAAALKADPNTVAATAGQARLASLRGDNATAVTLWTDVVRRAPLPEYLVELGDLLESLGRTTQARQQFAVVLGSAALSRANGVQTDLEIANFESDHGDAQAALTAARAEWGRRHSVLVADAYAWALHAAGQDRQALSMSRLALSLGTADARLLLHAAVIEQGLGLTSAARAHLAGAMRLRGMLDPLQRQLADRTQVALDPAGGRSAQ
jgi:tetratricopeptide (TPR) repeat protein